MQLVGKLMLHQCTYYQITRFVTLYSLSQDFLHVRVQRNCHPDAVNSLPCVEGYHTIEPFVLPKPLYCRSVLVFTHSQAKTNSCWPLYFVNTQPGLSCILLTNSKGKSPHTLNTQLENLETPHREVTRRISLRYISSLVCLHNWLPSYSTCLRSSFPS